MKYIIVQQIAGITANLNLCCRTIKVVIKTIVRVSSNFSSNFSEVLSF